jgi:alpha-galactosidase
LKITIIGGGSYAWMPILITNFLLLDFFNNTRICLMDIDAAALGHINKLCSLLSSKLPKNNMMFETTTNLDEALYGASYVIMAITNGGYQTEIMDHKIARKYGYFNMIGHEVGIAGCSRTLRHVPEAVRIARKMEKLCSSAVFLNVSNPLTAITRAINKYTSIKAYGFCHGVTNHLHPLFPLFGAKSWDEVDFNAAGVDHCSWLLDVRVRGKDALAIMKEKGLIESAEKGLMKVTVDDPFSGREKLRLRFILWGILGYMPAISDSHIIEFFGQLIGTEELRNHYGVHYDHIADKTKGADGYKNEVLDLLEEKTQPSLKRNNEIVDKFICAINGGGAFIDVMNVPNEGQIPNLPMDSIVETKCLVDSTGVHPIHVGKLPHIIESIVRPIVLREELYMEAAMENSFDKLRSALSTDPLVNDFRKIDNLCRELIDYNNQFRAEDNY